MHYRGEFRKMPVVLDSEEKVHYSLWLHDTNSQSNQFISANDFIGKQVSIHFEGNIFCKKCGRKTAKSYDQGFCYVCMRDAPEAAECIIHPELCRAHLGEGRDPAWEEAHQNQPHFVYLAATDIIKVGVTRDTQIPTRWIDQGANSAIRLAETPNRYLAGVIEVALKSKFADKTNWRSMLQNNMDDQIDLLSTKMRLHEELPTDITQYITEDNRITHLHYPVSQYPQKVISLSLDKTPDISGKLTGIKAQYFLFEGGQVFNIRKHESYQIDIGIE